MGHVLIVCVLVLIYGAFVLVSPTKQCRCDGRCGRCKGTGRRFRLGARLVHRSVVKGYRQARKRWDRAPAIQGRRR